MRKRRIQPGEWLKAKSAYFEFTKADHLETYPDKEKIQPGKSYLVDLVAFNPMDYEDHSLNLLDPDDGAILHIRTDAEKWIRVSDLM